MHACMHRHTQRHGECEQQAQSSHLQTIPAGVVNKHPNFFVDLLARYQDQHLALADPLRANVRRLALAGSVDVARKEDEIRSKLQLLWLPSPSEMCENGTCISTITRWKEHQRPGAVKQQLRTPLMFATSYSLANRCYFVVDKSILSWTNRSCCETDGSSVPDPTALLV